MRKEDKELVAALLNTAIVATTLAMAIIKGAQLSHQDILSLLHITKIVE